MHLNKLKRILMLALLALCSGVSGADFFSFMDWCEEYGKEKGMDVIGVKIIYPLEGEEHKPLAKQRNWMSICLHSWLESENWMDSNNYESDKKLIAEFIESSIMEISSEKYAFVIFSKEGKENFVHLVDPDLKKTFGIYALSMRLKDEMLSVSRKNEALKSIVCGVRLLEDAMPYFFYKNSVEGYLSFENRCNWSAFFRGDTVVFSFYDRSLVDGGGLDVVIEPKENKILGISDVR